LIYLPKLVTVLREGYTTRKLAADAAAGLVVGVVALPLSLAFAIASGVKPEQGLYTAIVAGFVIAALGGTRTQVSGPTGAFVVIIYGIVQRYGYEGLAVATLIAGGLLIAMGLARLGRFLKFIPYPVVVGFTSGIAVIIATSQIRDFLGLQVETLPANFVELWPALLRALPTLHVPALAVGAGSLLLLLAWPRSAARVPAPLVAMLAATAAVHALGLDVQTIGDRFGAVPAGLPRPRLPAVSWGLIREMFSPAVTIALLAAIESLLAAVVADGMLGTRHRPNAELLAQGVGNILSPLFGGIPATGAVARTATNIKSGGRTPVAAMVHSATLMLIVLFLGGWAALIPLPALAAILLFVAYNMCEWRAFYELMRAPRADVTVLLVTFALTLAIDLTVAIQVGVVLAAFLLLARISDDTQMRMITETLDTAEEEDTERGPRDIGRRVVPRGVEVFEIQGPLFFVAIERFKDALRRVQANPRVLILRMRSVHTVDATGLHALEDLCERTRREGGTMLLTGVGPEPLAAMERSGLLDRLGRENVMRDIDAALARADELIGRVAAPSLADRSPK
jgi:SulP family sulfate permease